jgi:predicted AlkP superfamily pyrophosphatase or phosphodiesterase
MQARRLFMLLAIPLNVASYALNNTILFVWDGLRPDSITEATTPNLFKLANSGTYFNDNHSSFPTFTMMNASGFATGDFAGKTGFYGNTLWNNKVHGTDASGKVVDFQQPVFTEDYKILTDLNKQEPLTEVYTLFGQAHKKGLMIAAVGKSGPAYFQDYQEQGVIFDEKHVYPLDFAKYLQSINYPLPVNTIHSYADFKLNSDNGNPTLADKVINMDDKVTSDPTSGITSPYSKSNTYLMDSYLDQIMPRYHLQLSVVWLRDPDTTEHNYGVGSAAYYDALAKQDALLGKLIARLKSSKQWDKTNLIVVSDHGHSNVSGSLSQFPLRSIKDGKVGDIDNISGYSVSGDFRPADLLSRAGFKAYDGVGCQYDPVLSGISKDGKPVYPTLYDKDGSVCGGNVKVVDQNGHRSDDVGTKYNTPAYIVPQKLPVDSVVVAGNGGSTYFYIPNHNQKLVEKLVKFVQSRDEFGAVFIDTRYGDIPGTFKLAMVKLQNGNQRNPDLIVSSNYDEKARIQGFAGIEHNSSGSDRGMHGSFSPTDVHNTLIAYGPDFKHNYIDNLPSGNVDVAPTIAYLLGLKLPDTDGRVLYEALVNGKDTSRYSLHMVNYTAKTANYSTQLQTKVLNDGSKEYSYFDFAKALRY